MPVSLHTLKPSYKEKALRLLNKDQLRRLLAEVGDYYSEDDSKELLVQTVMRLPLQLTIMVESHGVNPKVPVDRVGAVR